MGGGQIHIKVEESFGNTKYVTSKVKVRKLWRAFDCHTTIISTLRTMCAYMKMVVMEWITSQKLFHRSNMLVFAHFMDDLSLPLNLVFRFFKCGFFFLGWSNGCAARVRLWESKGNEKIALKVLHPFILEDVMDNYSSFGFAASQNFVNSKSW